MLWMPAKEDYGDMVLATEGLPKRWSASVIKVSGQIHSNAVEKTSLQLHSNNFGLKQLSTIVKKFHY